LIFLGLQQSLPHDPSQTLNFILVRDLQFDFGSTYMFLKTFREHDGATMKKKRNIK